MNILDHSYKVLKYFEEITRIPHPSYHEELLTDYVEEFASNRNLRYLRDTMNNIVIYKEASKGYEKHPGVMLQAHLDMVADVKPGFTHDFLQDGLSLYVKDGFLYANGTTLGADDGLGVALMLAILDNDTLCHPPLECIFTVQEEVGLFGAAGINPDWLLYNRLISLDGDAFGKTTITSCGGRDVILKKKINKEKVMTSGYKIIVSGLKGGHSGDVINQERGNATNILARILMELEDVRLESMMGGEKANAIPLYAEARFTTNNVEQLDSIIQQIKYEFRITDPHLDINIEAETINELSSLKDTQNLLRMIHLSPQGVLVYSQEIEFLPLLSLNLGILKYDKECYMDYSVRGTTSSYRDLVSHKIQLLASIFDFESYIEGEHDGWDYEPHSPLRKLVKDVYKEKFDKEMIEEATHGGLETGIFKGYNEKLDIVTLGANAFDIHTYNEHLDIQSLIDVYELLKEILLRM